MPSLEDRSIAFIVRIWWEDAIQPVPDADWRGSIEHVQSGRRQGFRDLATAARFIESCVDARHSGAPPTA